MKNSDMPAETVDLAIETRQKIYESFGVSSELLWRVKRDGPKDLEDILVDTMKQQGDLLKKLQEYINVTST